VSAEGDAVEEPAPRRAQQSQAIVAAARRLIDEKGGGFTTQELIKEAGVALQTFYRHFPGKDQLLLSVIEDMISENSILYEQSAAHLDDPLDRLHVYVTAALRSLRQEGGHPRFITAEHWRLHQLFPDEIAQATKPFADIVQRELEAAEAVGLLQPANPERDAWMIMTLVMSAYHHYAFHLNDPRVDTVADDVWRFCLAAVGGTDRRRGSRKLLRR
jgi:AcrR family transcriptional regulator